jgi:predicted nucleic acid-binding protein
MKFILGKDSVNMIFLDSNIWLYTLLAQQSAVKSSVSRNLIQANRQQIAISSQVVIEVAANLLRKGNFDEPEIAKYILAVCQNLFLISPNFSHKCVAYRHILLLAIPVPNRAKRHAL